MKRLEMMFARVVAWADRRPGQMWLGIFVFALLPRVLAPSGVFINFDAAGKWILRTKNFLDGVVTLDPAMLVQAPHPGVTLTWFMSLGEWANQAFHLYRLWPDPVIGYITVLKLPLLIVTSAMAATLFLFLRGLVTTRFSLVVAVLWALEPIYLVFSRYLHLDGLLTGLFVLIAIALWRARLETGWRWTVMAAVMMGVAALTRINIIPSLILTACLATFAKQGEWRRWVQRLLAMLGLVIITLVAIWPALLFAWPAVVDIIRRGIELGTTEHEVPYRVDTHAVVRRMVYLIFLLIRTWPWVAIFSGLGAVMYLVRWCRRRQFVIEFPLYLFGAAVAVLVVLFLADKKLDRYAAPAVGPMLLLAGMTIVRMGRMMDMRWRRYTIATFFVLVILNIFAVLRHAPYYQTYQNEMSGFLQRSSTIATSATFSTAWGEGYYETAKYFESLGWPSIAVRNARSLCIHLTPDDPTRYPFNPEAKGACDRKIFDLTLAGKAEYLAISHATFAQQVYPQLLRDIKRLGWQPIHVITLNHQPTVYIYKNAGGLRGNYYR